jgi:nucleoid-associated protein YgaU|tara:strand:- start:598 stop:942 length:345 start_codon:yes stop_codon:yes gene_type:complete
MGISRYDVRRVIANEDQGYQEDILERRGIKRINHFSTPTLRYPTSREIADMQVNAVTWKRGTSLAKIAAKEYGDPKLWWVIAWFNKLPTDAHYNLGDKVFVPKPLERILRQFRV